MKKKRSLCLDDADEIIRPPAYPIPGYKLLEELRARLNLNGGKSQPPLLRLARYLGIPTSTCHHWFSVSHLSGIQAMLCVLERLDGFQWVTVFEKYLREFPTLHHEKLAHDKEGVAKLLELLKQGHGITLIRGGTDADRTFMLTALGHTFSMRDPMRRRVIGMDRHEPRTFVPLENVVYFKNTISSARLRELLLEHWAKLANAKNALIVCNRILSHLPEKVDEVVKCAVTNHLLVSDDKSTDDKRGLIGKIPVHHIIEIMPPAKATAEISFRVVRT